MPLVDLSIRVSTLNIDGLSLSHYHCLLGLENLVYPIRVISVNVSYLLHGLRSNMPAQLSSLLENLRRSFIRRNLSCLKRCIPLSHHPSFGHSSNRAGLPLSSNQRLLLATFLHHSSYILTFVLLSGTNSFFSRWDVILSFGCLPALNFFLHLLLSRRLSSRRNWCAWSKRRF